MFRDECVDVFRITTYQKFAKGRLMLEVPSKIQQFCTQISDQGDQRQQLEHISKVISNSIFKCTQHTQIRTHHYICLYTK